MTALDPNATHVRVQTGVVFGLLQRLLEMPLVVREVGARGEQHPCPRPHRAVRDRLEIRGEQVGQALELPGGLEVRRKLEQPLGSFRRTPRREPESVLAELHRLLASATRKRARGCSRDGTCEPLVGIARREREVPSAKSLVADRRREPQMELATLAHVRPPLHGCSEQGMRCTKAAAADDEQAPVDRVVENRRLGNGAEPGRLDLGAERDGEEQRAHRLR